MQDPGQSDEAMAGAVWEKRQRGVDEPSTRNADRHVPDTIELIVESRSRVSGMTQDFVSQPIPGTPHLVELPTLEEAALPSSGPPGDGSAPPVRSETGGVTQAGGNVGPLAGETTETQNKSRLLYKSDAADALP